MIYIIISLLLYTAAVILGTLASRNANTNLVSAITTSVSMLIPVATVIPILNTKTFQTSKMGIIYAVLGGIVIALFTMTLNKSFAVNKVAIVTPIVFGGAIFLSAILGYFIFNEKITRFQSIGLFLLAIGFSLIIYARWTGR